MVARPFRRSAKLLSRNGLVTRKTEYQLIMPPKIARPVWRPDRLRALAAVYRFRYNTAGFGGSEGRADGATTGSEAGASYGVGRRGVRGGCLTDGGCRPVAAHVR